MKTGDVSLSSDRQSDLPPYRAISRLSIVACVLGVSSVMALVHPLFCFLPAVAAVVSVVALRTISRKEDVLVGRKAALLGLAAALFLGVWVSMDMVLNRVIMPRQARPFAIYWLDLVRDGRVQEAHQWTVPTDYRMPMDTDLKEFYESDTNAKGDLDVFLEDEVFSVLNRIGRAGKPRFARTVDVNGDGERGVTTLDFEVTTDDHSTEPFDIRMVIERTLAADDRAVQWRVVQVRSRALESR